MKFRTLKKDEIDVRVGSTFSTGYALLLYKDARADMNILDECVGADNWQRDHKEIKGNLYCGVGINRNYDNKLPIVDSNNNIVDYRQINVEPVWIWKWDCGTESNTEKEKGEASDSFKRACVNWGIGRELYTSPLIFIECQMDVDKDRNGKTIYKLPNVEKKRKFKVAEIEYNEKNEISKLVIVDNKGVQVYPKSTQASDLTLMCEQCGTTLTDKVAKYSKSKCGKELCYNCQQKLVVKEVEV